MLRITMQRDETERGGADGEMGGRGMDANDTGWGARCSVRREEDGQMVNE